MYSDLLTEKKWSTVSPTPALCEQLLDNPRDFPQAIDIPAYPMCCSPTVMSRIIQLLERYLITCDYPFHESKIILCELKL